MSVKIILDETLEQKEIKNFTKLEIKSELDLKTLDNYFSQYEHSERLLERQDRDYRTQNNFINAFLDSYNFHKVLKIRPDDIKLQILTIISICVNNNPEKFRNYFVDHEGKKNLIVKSTVFSADYFCGKFAELLEENIKDKDFASHYTIRFTTTNQIISTVNNITLMNTLKEYFSYSMILCCGIPAVILEGTDEDWIQLNESYLFFKKIFAETELKDWFRHFDKVMELFMMMRKINSNNESQNIWTKIMSYFTNTNTNTNNNDITYIKEMWKRVISYIPQGSGGDQILGGWIRLFVPYNSSNKIIGGLNGEIACMDLTKSVPDSNDYYKWQDNMKQFYMGEDWNHMFSSYITTPAELVDYDTEYSVEFYSGFFQPYLSESDEICMNIGYIIREDQQIKKDKLKKYYINKGVENDGFNLKIPKILQKNVHEILDIFDKYSYNYYGTDPEEETRKQYFIDEGVKKEKTKYSYKCLVPNKFKSDENVEKIIEEIKKLFEVYNLEFYDL